MAINEHTVRAVRRQLEAMKCATFDVGVRNEATDKMMFPFGLGVSAAYIMKHLAKLVWMNSKGEHIYLRAGKELDRALVLVDDIEEVAVDEMDALGIPPCLVIETSPKNLQAWVDLGPEPMPGEERKFFARWMAERFDGDMGSTDAIHLGRMAGFVNCKEKHRNEGRGFGQFPFVLVRRTRPVVAPAAERVRAWAHREVEAEKARLYASATSVMNLPHRDASGEDARSSWVRYAAEWLANPGRRLRADGTDDLSVRDFAVISRMLREGYAPAMLEGLLAASATRKPRPETYAANTVSRALRALGLGG